jgi:molybdopterin synthase sulfur carrier subunit
VPTLKLFAQAREAAGTGHDVVPDGTVADLLELARQRYGEDFAQVLDTCKVWVNGQPADEATTVGGDDEVALLPPVSGG